MNLNCNTFSSIHAYTFDSFVSIIMYKHMGVLFRHDMDTKYVMHTFGAYKQNNIKKKKLCKILCLIILKICAMI
jgi:hypothetical protein